MGRFLSSDAAELYRSDGAPGPLDLPRHLLDHEGGDVRATAWPVQVITADQIAASGAQDLREVLELVPGLAPYLLQDGRTGTGVHGMPASGGSLLVLMDGVVLNDLERGTWALTRAIPVTAIDRVEVVLGPTSEDQGGMAFLGTIHIITTNADQGTGARLVGRHGHTSGGTTLSGVELAGALRVDRDQEVDFFFTRNQGHWSTANVLGTDSLSRTLTDSTSTSALGLEVGYRWRRLAMRVTHLEGTDGPADAAYHVQRSLTNASIGQQVPLATGLRLDWRADHTDQRPRGPGGSDPALMGADSEVRRTTGSIGIRHRVLSWLSWDAGFQLYGQRSTLVGAPDTVVFQHTGDRVLALMGTSWKIGVEARTRFGTLHAGFRSETNDLAGSASAPMIGYHVVRGPWHGRLLWSSSYRLSWPLEVEATADQLPPATLEAPTWNASVGRRLGDRGSVELLVHHTRLGERNTDETGGPGTNGTQGADLRFAWSAEKLIVHALIGVQRPLDGDVVPALDTASGRLSGIAGMSSERAVLVLGYTVSDRLRVRTRVNWTGRTWILQPAPDGWNAEALPSVTLLHLGLDWRPVRALPWELGLACNNLLEAERFLGSALPGVPALPLDGREWRISLKIPFGQ